MKDLLRRITTLSITGALLLGLPLLGIKLAGKPIDRYWEFPPLTQYVEHAPFAWWAFIALAIGIVVVIAPFELRVISWRRSVNGLRRRAKPFPWWGWLGVAGGIISWVLAWSRFDWFAGWQLFTFSPLWFAYIVVVNALLYRRSGQCMLTHRPAYLALLFAASAGFWWFFEYLNRFVQNWYYVGIDGLTKWEYFLFATLPFSTVLPAVLGTYELLESNPKRGAGLDHFLRVDVGYSRWLAWLALVLASAGLTGIGVWPDILFPLLWVSPLLIVTALQAIQGRPTVFFEIKEGNWRKVYLLAVAALICGFFWEMWNIYSLAKWIYTVPLVGRFKLFEMPILGYTGYLPFGLECAVIAEAIAGYWSQRAAE